MNIEINSKGININSNKNKSKKLQALAHALDCSLYGLLILTYAILSLFVEIKFESGLNAWACLWPIILLGNVPSGILKTIVLKRANEFPIYSIILFAYLFMGMAYNMWHPYWVIILIIPIYYLIANSIDALVSYLRKSTDDNKDIDIDYSKKD